MYKHEESEQWHLLKTSQALEAIETDKKKHQQLIGAAAFETLDSDIAKRIEDNETLKQTAKQAQKDREAMLEHWRSVYNKKLQRMAGLTPQLQDRRNSQQDLLSEVSQTVPHNVIFAKLSKHNYDL